jgi:Lysine methyltransferase
MSSFAFSFGLEGSDDCVSELVSNSESADNGAINLKEEPTVKPCFEVLMSPLPETSTLTNFTVHHIGDLAFKQVIPTKHDIIGALTTPANSNLEESDIISGQYEGGFKIWECSYDLADVILEINMTHTSKHRRILELGCGHGVPGIVAMMTFDDIEEIVFSDFNDDVLELTTWPNIILNSPTEKLKNIRCIAGDWSSISPLLGKFDLILSAETLYTVESCKKVSHRNTFTIFLL